MKCQSAVGELAQVLASRFSRISRRWEASTPGERQEDLENVLVARIVVENSRISLRNRTIR